MVRLWIPCDDFTHRKLFFLHWGLNQDTRQGAEHTGSRNASKNRGSAQQSTNPRVPLSHQHPQNTHQMSYKYLTNFRFS